MEYLLSFRFNESPGFFPDALFQYGLEKGYNTMVSTDMGNVSQKVPAIHPMYYIDTPISLHHADFAKQASFHASQHHRTPSAFPHSSIRSSHVQ